MQGWVKLHRRLLLKGYANRPSYVALWIHILLSVNHQEKEFLWNDKMITIKPGQFITGRKELSDATGIPETTIERILNIFVNDGQIGQQKTTKYRLITVLNWDKHQIMDNKRTTSGQQADTNKNDKNDKNKLGELGSPELKDNQKDMGWNKFGDEPQEATIDYDTGEEVADELEAEKAEVKELNAKIRHNLKLVEEARGLPFGKGKDMNYHVKIYRDMLDNGWSHQTLVEEFIELINTDHWWKKRKMGQYPGMNTLQFTLRNKQPS